MSNEIVKAVPTTYILQIPQGNEIEEMFAEAEDTECGVKWTKQNIQWFLFQFW